MSYEPRLAVASQTIPGATHGWDGDEDLRLIADSARDFAMIFLDKERNVVRWSLGAEYVLGWTEAEAINWPERDLIFTPESRAAGVPQQETAIALRDGRAEDARWHQKKDGTLFWSNGVMTPLYDPATGALRGFGKVMRDLTALKLMEVDLQQAKATLETRVIERTQALQTALAERQSLLQQAVQTQEQERRRISHELHDQTGQHLTGLALGLKSLEDIVTLHCPSETGAGPLLERLCSIAKDLTIDIHRLAVELRPPALDDLGLVPALQAYIEEWAEHTGVSAAFAPFGMADTRLPSSLETIVYRVVQEALTNVARYAVPTGATQVAVTLHRQRGYVRATVEDNGAGFDVDDALRSGRLGLIGMRERAELADGMLEIESSSREGTTVFLRVPVPGEPQAS